MSTARFESDCPAVERATPADAAGLLALVESSGLPLDGLVAHLAAHPDLVWVMRGTNGAVVACAVIEPYGPFGLLRSVAVTRDTQSRGLGTALISGVCEDQAVRQFDAIYLLTETAAPFFAGMGFLPVARPSVPGEITASAEFSAVCPASARVMWRMPPVDVAGGVVRAALVGDEHAIARIYNQGIEDRLGTFETRLRSPADVHAWFDGRHPSVVVESRDAPGDPVAFGATFEYRSRNCYAGVAEFSVYVAREARGRGYGRTAMDALIVATERAGFWKLLSRVFVENTSSRSLLAGRGFREVGIYERHGQLDGRWRDVVVIERLLGDAAST